MLRIENVNKSTGNFSLAGIDFTVNKGDYFALIGESGAGKSLLLEIITGLLLPDSGNIYLNDININSTPPQKRKIGIVYQKPTLFPHMSVFENIAYPLKIRKLSKDKIISKVHKLAEETEITHILERTIINLSGGEMQRVTIARTLATDPEILLLDEPLSYLDVQLKKGMLSLFRKLNANGQTEIHVTHDYEEVIALTNRIAIIEKGKIVQAGTPDDVFRNPRSAFIADFAGISNFYKGQLKDSNEQPGLKIFETTGLSIYVNSEEQVNSYGYIIIPGEAVTISDEKLNSSAVNNFSGTVKDIYKTRTGIELIVDVGIDVTARISGYSLDRLRITTGKKLWISFKASSVTFVRN